VVLAGHELELQRKKQSFLEDSNPFKHPFFVLGNPRKRKNEDGNASDKIRRPKKQNLTKDSLAHIQPPTSQRHKGSSEASRAKSDQTEKSNRTSHSRYSLRSQTATSTLFNLLPFTHGSDLSSDDNQFSKPMGDETPRLKKDELEVLQKVINQTKVLSWFSCLARKFGFKNFQTLKAAEWQILMTLYSPLALGPL
ncbi:hypothetical protein O181_041914, partial [Austropuccinia psidii MF-1]|nr:hypothetical protein [Austropuccinia psidii MF-1]